MHNSVPHPHQVLDSARAVFQSNSAKQFLGPATCRLSPPACVVISNLEASGLINCLCLQNPTCCKLHFYNRTYAWGSKFPHTIKSQPILEHRTGGQARIPKAVLASTLTHSTQLLNAFGPEYSIDSAQLAGDNMQLACQHGAAVSFVPLSHDATYYCQFCC